MSHEAVRLLSSSFTTGAVAPSGGNFEAEARATLDAVGEPAIRHAITSLGALRAVVDDYVGLSREKGPLTARARQGLQEYTYAVACLATKLSNPSAASIKAALLCCQIFICIEFALKDFTSAANHLIRGVKIMHQFRTRPCIADDGRVYATALTNMPSLDEFLVKLMLSPCPGNQFLWGSKTKRLPGSLDPQSSDTDGLTSKDTTFSAIYSTLRNRLSELTQSTNDYLRRVSRLDRTNSIQELLNERQLLLEQFRQWENAFAPLYRSEPRKLPDSLLGGAAFASFIHHSLYLLVSLSLKHPDAEIESLDSQCNSIIKVAQHMTSMARSTVAPREPPMVVDV